MAEVGTRNAELSGLERQPFQLRHALQALRGSQFAGEAVNGIGGHNDDAIALQECSGLTQAAFIRVVRVNPQKHQPLALA